MTVWIKQAAVIAVKDGRACLVTSRSGRRWVLPKGVVDPGHTPGEAALIEAWEEAGLVGVLDPDPVGSYVYEKFDRGHHVLVYVMRVTEACDDWPERPSRERVWLSAEEVVERVDEPGLRAILRHVFNVAGTDHIAVA